MMARFVLLPATLLLSTAALADPAAEAPDESLVLRQEGRASVYSGKLAGKTTATGERVDPRQRTAASPSLPLGATATVTNTWNGKRVIVRIDDRSLARDGRILDLSRRAAAELGLKTGTAPVVVEAHPGAQPTPGLKTKVAAAAQQQVAAR
jgi:rare lipoprotein A